MISGETEAAVQSLSLVDVMLENLQLRVHNVHVRFEDSTCGPTPIALGLVMDHLTVTTTDSAWRAG